MSVPMHARVGSVQGIPFGLAEAQLPCPKRVEISSFQVTNMHVYVCVRARTVLECVGRFWWSCFFSAINGAIHVCVFVCVC